MKKILLALLLMLPCFVNAMEIEKVFIDSEIEIAGGLYVREIIVVKNQDQDLNLNVYLSDKSLMDFDGSVESFIGSKIYNATDVSIKNISTIKDGTDVNEMYKENFKENYLTEIKNYKLDTKDGYTTIKLKNTNKTVTYYLEYSITNILVEHNDCAEFYYRYFDKFDYDIKSVSIITRLPNESKLFEVWAHGNKKNSTVSKDINSYLVLNEIKEYKKNTFLDNRIIFDKDLFMININKDKKSNINAIDLIKQTEKELEKSVDVNLIRWLLYGSCVFLMILICAYVVYRKRTKKN